MRLHPSLALVGVAALLLSGAATPTTHPPSAATPSTFTADETAKARKVTLVTGDTVLVMPGGDVAFMPGEGRHGVPHVTYQLGSGAERDQYVVPVDALGPMRAGVLDARLFDITDLVADGYADTGPLPVIVRDAPGAFATATATGQLWDRVADERVEHVWLDGKAHITLAESVPQIGAPTAWQAGYTGKGVTVAILDSGYDPTHPDLAGRVTKAQDFTDTSPGAIDGHGHGTHVASIAAGSGAASNGKYKGVAPDANLLVGKVCTNAGECQDSDIIEGLEWAAANGAAVANLSLGAGPTDGTDPLSTAVNEITARTGMLIVVAAGNDGCSGCVSSPGSAEAALTVGSVTKQDTLSPFSSQGPRVGDGAVKPDIAAPGSSITAARASGTTMGTPVDDHYTTADGTSMAAPHTTGAAALLKQVHPDWTSARLKAALMGSAKGLDGLSVFEEGAGRLNAAAVTTTVTPDVGSLSYGSFSYPYTQDPAAKSVTYTNDADTDITLNLAITGDSLFTADRSTVTVPAHGTATVSVTAKVIGGTTGDHGAVLAATAEGVSVRTALGVVLTPEAYNLNLDITSRNGGAVEGDFFGPFALVIGLDSRSFDMVSLDADGKGSIHLPPGRYEVSGMVRESGDSPATTTFATAVTIAHTDVTTAVDFRAGELVDVDLDADGAVLDTTMEAVTGVDAEGQYFFSFNGFGRKGIPSYSIPNADPGSGIEFLHAASYGSPKGAADPYSYSLFFLKTGVGMPGRTTFTAHDADLAREDAVYHSQGIDTVGERVDWNLDINFFSIDSPDVAVPSRRTEYYTPGRWIGTFQLGDKPGAYEFDERDPIRVAGTTTAVAWGQAPLGVGPVSSYRDGDQIGFIPAMYDDSNPESWLTNHKSDTVSGSASLTVNGKEVPINGPTACWRDGILPAGTSGTFVFTCDTTRVNKFSVLGTASSAKWTFHSEPSEPGTMAQPPMLGVRLASPSVVNGYAPARKVQMLTLDVFRAGATGRLGTKELTFEVSYDDGKNWKKVPLLRFGDHATALMAHPKDGKFVSTRITAVDGDGNAVTQKTIRAYGLS